VPFLSESRSPGAHYIIERAATADFGFQIVQQEVEHDIAEIHPHFLISPIGLADR
jgi:hypothetical protein